MVSIPFPEAMVVASTMVHAGLSFGSSSLALVVSSCSQASQLLQEAMARHTHGISASHNCMHWQGRISFVAIQVFHED